MRRLVLRLIINAAALYAAAALVPGIEVKGGWPTFAVMALIFGLVNALVRPVIKLLTCPLLIVTLGLFVFVINALMLWFAAWVGRTLGAGFYIEGLRPALLGALVVSLVSCGLTLLIPAE